MQTSKCEFRAQDGVVGHKVRAVEHAPGATPADAGGVAVDRDFAAGHRDLLRVARLHLSLLQPPAIRRPRVRRLGLLRLGHLSEGRAQIPMGS